MKRFIDNFLYYKGFYKLAQRLWFLFALILVVTAVICAVKSLFLDAFFSLGLAMISYYFTIKLRIIQNRKEMADLYETIELRKV